MHSKVNDKPDKLSTWKDIAAYLNCNTRTCIRWEKQLGLPIHRFEGKHRSHVFAFKQELDVWLENRLSDNQKEKKKPKSLSRIQILTIIIIPVALICLGVYFLIFRESESNSAKNTSDAIQSTGALTLKAGDIVSTEFSPSGNLKVWRPDSRNTYSEIWRVEPVRHASLAIGNLDEKEGNEIVAPGLCREKESVGERIVTKWRYFLNVYKPGITNWWKTTFYSKKNSLFEDTFWESTETKIGDVDQSAGQEVLMITKHGLGVFKYMPDEKEIRLLSSRYSFIKGTDLVLKSMEVANIDDDPLDEIIIAADEWENEETVWNKGWILILKVHEGWPEIERAIPTDANFAFQSLKSGDVINGGKPEIISPGYRNSSDIWNTYIMAWDEQGKMVIDRPIYGKGDLQVKLIHLDVGDISPDLGEEVVVGLHDPNELICFSWNGTNLVEKCSRFPIDDKVVLMNVAINETGRGKDSLHEIIAWGGNRVEGQKGRFYLEVFDYYEGFITKWKRLGGDLNDMRVSYAGFVRDRSP